MPNNTPTYTASDLTTAQTNLSNEQARRSQLVEKRDRLQNAYDSLSSYKDQFEEQKNTFNNSIYNGSFQWQGEKHDALAGEFGTFFYIYYNYNDVYNRIDNVLDDINLTRCSLDIEIDTCDGNISSLRTLVNIISTYLQNLTN